MGALLVSDTTTAARSPLSTSDWHTTANSQSHWRGAAFGNYLQPNQNGVIWFGERREDYVDPPSTVSTTCPVSDLVIDWVGGFHSSNHASFGPRSLDPVRFGNLVVVPADPLNG